jgi:hypothetical protein
MDTISLRSVNSTSDLLDSIDRIYFNEFQSEETSTPATTSTYYKDIIEYELKNTVKHQDIKFKISIFIVISYTIIYK